MNFTLRPYQAKAVEQVRAELRAGRGSVLLVAPTGGGKTICFCHIIESEAVKGSRGLVLAHREELIDQPSRKLRAAGLPHGIIRANDHRADASARTQLASVQTLARRLAGRYNMAFDYVIIDEAHHASRGSAYEKILDAVRAANPRAVVIGTTATPYRLDGKPLDIFEAAVNVATIDELIAGGYLVRPRVMIGRKVSLAGVTKTAGDYNLGDLERATNQPKILADIVSAWQRHAADRLTVGFACTIAHSKAIVAAFRAAGIDAEHLDGETPGEERRAILARLEAGFTRVVINVGVLTEGWDSPAVSGLIFARPTQSRSLWRQMAGRVLRPAPGKVDALILDHGNATETHGWLTDPDVIDLTGRVSADRAPADRRCKACRAEYAGAPTYCPRCGCALRGEGGERQDIELRHALGDRRYEMTEIEAREARKRRTLESADQKAFNGLIFAAYKKKYAPGWVVHPYRARTGKMPTPEMWAAAPIPVKLAFDAEKNEYKRVWVRPPAGREMA